MATKKTTFEIDPLLMAQVKAKLAIQVKTLKTLMDELLRDWLSK